MIYWRLGSSLYSRKVPTQWTLREEEEWQSEWLIFVQTKIGMERSTFRRGGRGRETRTPGTRFWRPYRYLIAQSKRRMRLTWRGRKKQLIAHILFGKYKIVTVKTEDLNLQFITRIYKKGTMPKHCILWSYRIDSNGQPAQLWADCSTCWATVSNIKKIFVDYVKWENKLRWLCNYIIIQKNI